MAFTCGNYFVTGAVNTACWCWLSWSLPIGTFTQLVTSPSKITGIQLKMYLFYWKLDTPNNTIKWNILCFHWGAVIKAGIGHSLTSIPYHDPLFIWHWKVTNSFTSWFVKVLDLKGLTWSKVDAKLQAGSPGSATSIAPCAGHSLVCHRFWRFW